MTHTSVTGGGIWEEGASGATALTSVEVGIGELLSLPESALNDLEVGRVGQEVLDGLIGRSGMVRSALLVHARGLRQVGIAIAVAIYSGIGGRVAVGLGGHGVGGAHGF